MKSKNLAKNSVKAKNIAKNAVTSAKVAKNAIVAAKLKSGSVNYEKLAAGTAILASATGGPAPADGEGLSEVPLSSPISVTPAAGEVLMANVEARASLTSKPGEECVIFVAPEIDGVPLAISEALALAAPGAGLSDVGPNGVPVSDISFPIGAAQSGQPQAVTLKVAGSQECTASSRVEEVAVVITRQR